MQRRRRLNPRDDAHSFAHTGRDKVGLDVRYINAFKGRGIFTSAPFEKGDFLCEYRGDLITKEECERRQRLYHDSLKVFMFEFRFNGKLWCVDAAKEDGSLGRLVNDDHINPNAKMKHLTVQGKPHLCLFAIRDIGPGEEITYNYGDSDWPWRSKKSGGMSSDVQHGEVPSTSELSTRTQKTSTHRGQKQMPTKASTGRLERFNKVTTEGGQIEMTASNLNQTSPVLDPLTRIGKDIDEEMPQRSPENTNSPSPDEDRVQVTTEGGQIEMTASNLNQTSPVLDPLTRIGKDIDEEMPQRSPENTNSPSPDEDRVQVTTEGGQIEMTASNLNQTSPVLDPLTRIGKDIDEEMPQRSPENTNSPSPDEDRVQVTTEGGQIEMTASNLNQTSPVLDPLTRIGKVGEM